MKGELTGLSLNYITKKPEITLTVDGDIEQLEKLKGQPLTVELKRFRRRRSLEANGLYWHIVSMIADATGKTNACVHNELLRSYGEIELIDGQAVYVVLPDTEAVFRQVDESETYHLRPTSQVQPGKDGMYRTWMMVRGSHSFNTKEMSRLIDGALYDARQLNIIIEISKKDYEEMMERYGKHHGD